MSSFIPGPIESSGPLLESMKFHRFGKVGLPGFIAVQGEGQFFNAHLVGDDLFKALKVAVERIKDLDFKTHGSSECLPHLETLIAQVDGKLPF